MDKRIGDTVYAVLDVASAVKSRESHGGTAPAELDGHDPVAKNETIDVGLVADNPGDWAFHCHVIEHQKTGLSGFIRVS